MGVICRLFGHQPVAFKTSIQGQRGRFVPAVGYRCSRCQAEQPRSLELSIPQRIAERLAGLRRALSRG